MLKKGGKKFWTRDMNIIPTRKSGLVSWCISILRTHAACPRTLMDSDNLWITQQRHRKRKPASIVYLALGHTYSMKWSITSKYTFRIFMSGTLVCVIGVEIVFSLLDPYRVSLYVSSGHDKIGHIWVLPPDGLKLTDALRIYE